MLITSCYSVKIKGYNGIFEDTLSAYRRAVGFFMSVALAGWDGLSELPTAMHRLTALEHATHATVKNPNPRYDFDHSDAAFWKFPSYLRRSAINAALGAVVSHKSNLSNWEKSPRGKRPSPPNAAHTFPAIYKDNTYVRTGDYTAKVKIWRNGDWVWLDVELRKSDADYIKRHLTTAKECSPTLRKRGKRWSLDFAFERKATLSKDEPQRIVAVDLGINSACTCVLMDKGGTVSERAFLRLPEEEDRLSHAIGRIKRAQRHGARQMPKLWASAKGANRHIAERTAAFIVEKAAEWSADVVVMEHLDLGGRKRGGSKRQRLHLWKVKDVLRMVTHRAHLNSIRVSTVNPWDTSRLAFDGSGRVARGKDLPDGIKARHGTCYSLCQFASGKLYNCDLNAAYNIGARYWIRNLQKSMSATMWQEVSAKVPGLLRGTTRTLSGLFSLNAELAALAA